MTLDVESVRARFPALAREEGGVPVAYLDGPGGTQVPRSVIDAMSSVLADGVSNLGGGFGASLAADEVTAAARSAMADFYGCSPGEIVFGQNMTSLTFAVSRAISREWGPGDSVLLTSLDHDANFTPWAAAARERGAEIRIAEFDPETGRLEPEEIARLLDDSVRLVAVCLASNALGTVVDVAAISQAAHEAGALVFVDAVHAGPHHRIDVEELGADFLVSSSYKFFGPHTGVLFGRADLLAGFDAFKVRPAPSDPPGKWETGTQSFESMAGITAAVDYLASLTGGPASRRERLDSSFAAINEHESALGARFLEAISDTSGVRLYGIPEMSVHRCATFALALTDGSAAEAADALGKKGIYVWSGNYYAVNVMDRLGVADQGGLIRVGFVHYNTSAEVDRVAAALGELAA